MDGCANALFLFLSMDIVSSQYVTRADMGMISLCVCIVASVFLCIAFSKGARGSIVQFFWTGQLFYVLFGLLLFFLAVEGFRLLPAREMADVEGLAIVASGGIYLFISLFSRIVTCFIVGRKRK